MQRVLSPWTKATRFALVCYACFRTDAMSLPSRSSRVTPVSFHGEGCALAMSSSGAGETVSTKRKAVVVGGGPVGLATALTLSNPPHCFDVTLLEQTVDDQSVARYDPTKAYLYLLNPRGQLWMKDFPSSLEKLEERGAYQPRMGNVMVVPADPKEPLPKSQTERKSVEGKIFKASNDSVEEKSYWIPRHNMILLLMEVISEQEEARKKDKDSPLGTITLVNGKQCQTIQRLKGEAHQLEVTVQDKKNKDIRYKHTYQADLVVGADGMNSAVRECLAEDNLAVETKLPLAVPTPTASWLTVNPEKFKVRKWASPSTGLRMKVLQFPPKFPIPDSDGSVHLAEGTRWFTFRSVNKGRYNRVGFGVLPVKDPKMVRSINVITRPHHEVWELKDGKEAKEWFSKAFPRLQFDDLADDKEWDRFVKAKGTVFPPCQYSPGLQVSSPDENAGVVLVGDAIHAFPPDIGQGINSGLSDVVALDRALRGNDIITGDATKNGDGNTPSLGSALKEYERVRLPEVQALIRIARFGAPYQYNQSYRKDRIGRFFWSLNVLSRVLLNKATFGLVPPPTVMMVQNRELTFRQVMRRADFATAVLTALVLTLFWAVCGVQIRKLAGL